VRKGEKPGSYCEYQVLRKKELFREDTWEFSKDKFFKEINRVSRGNQGTSLSDVK
jgi:hypothetical protein